MDSKDKLLDELLIMKFNAGDANALTLFIKRWHTKLIWFSFQTVHNKEEAQDIVQDNWPTIIKGLNTIKDLHAYRAWMYRIIRNKSVDRIRQIQREKVAIDNLTYEELANEAIEPLDTTKIMLDKLRQLPNELKEVLQLFYLQGQTVQELSGLLGVPNGTIKSRLFRARQLMKNELLAINRQRYEK